MIYMKAGKKKKAGDYNPNDIPMAAGLQPLPSLTLKPQQEAKVSIHS